MLHIKKDALDASVIFKSSKRKSHHLISHCNSYHFTVYVVFKCNFGCEHLELAEHSLLAAKPDPWP